MTKDEIARRITNLFRKYINAKDSRTYNIIPPAKTAGKLYEAYILARITQQLYKIENNRLLLINSNYISLKSNPGAIDRTKPRINVYRDKQLIGEIWTDIEFLALSYFRNNSATKPPPPQYGDYHELDIVMVPPNTSGRPSYEFIWLGVECKNTGYNKGLLKEILGVRRELSLLRDYPVKTQFLKWPRPDIPAYPPSCLLVYSTDSKVNNYASPGTIFGIDFIHEPMTP
jgi:hypothetical protein